MILVEQNLDFHRPRSRSGFSSFKKARITREVQPDVSATQALLENLSESHLSRSSGRDRGRPRPWQSEDQLSDQCAASLKNSHACGRTETQILDTLMQRIYAAYDAVVACRMTFAAGTYPRTPGYRPEAKKTSTTPGTSDDGQGRVSGKLAGKKIALKDNVCLAGVR